MTKASEELPLDKLLTNLLDKEEVELLKKVIESKGKEDFLKGV